MIERTAPYCPQCGAPTQLQDRYGRLRPVCTACSRTVFFDPKVAVTALVIRQNGGDVPEVLLVKRANEPSRGSWELPAGFVEPDEDPADAVAREVLEETGVLIKIGGLVDILHRPDPGGMADLVIVYKGLFVSGDVTAGDDADEAAWFKQDALPEVALVTTQQMTQLWLAGKI